MAFKISSLKREQFQHLFGLNDDELAELGAKRYVADVKPGFPCRVSLSDANAGERVILLPFRHQPENTPYQAAGPIFVREAGQTRDPAVDEVPEILHNRLLSLRADAQDMLVASDVIDGMQVENHLNRFFDDPAVSYIHVHFAKPGCYACRVDRNN